jgi:mycofactocin system creatininase family protein
MVSSVELADMVWTEIDDPILVIPVGSCEQHGPHLPLATDTIIATKLAEDLAHRRGDAVVSPPLSITASGEHQGFPGTLSIGAEVMASVVIELVRSADWAAGVVIVNGHGGNVNAMETAARAFDDENRNALIWWPQIPDGDLHAGHTETSVMLLLAPNLVRLDQANAGPMPAMVDLIRHGVKPLSESGVLGDPLQANAVDGSAIFSELADQLSSAVDRWLDTREVT